jgi:hypothetical protein
VAGLCVPAEAQGARCATFALAICSIFHKSRGVSINEKPSSNPNSMPANVQGKKYREDPEISRDKLFELFDWLHKLYQFTPVSEGYTYGEVYDELEHRLNVRVSESSGLELAHVERIHREFHEETQKRFLEGGE